jgi:glycine cleavage system H lipoate-binding protein
MVIVLAVRHWNKKVKMPMGTIPKYAKVLNESVLSFPNGLYFDKSHTWVFMEEGGMVKFGIDDFIPNVTGEYTRVIMKNPGETVKRREPVVTLVQKGKQITIHAPVSGTIKEINEALVSDPFTINSSPYNEGWIYKIEPSNWFREIRFYKLGETYKVWIGNEITRLKDFLACSFNIKKLSEEELAFQEGGELILEPLKDLEPKIWEDFQSYFIESADKY